MYKIVINDDDLIYAPGYGVEYSLIDPVLSMQLNTAGTLTFTVHKDNCRYNDLHKLKTLVRVVEDSYDTNHKRIWSGRVIKITTDFVGRKHVECEGELAYFCDYYEAPFTYLPDCKWAGSVGQFWTNLITHYNSIITDSWKQFRIGTISDSLVNKRLRIEQTGYESAWSMITDDLIANCGGYVSIRHDTVDGSIMYVDYLDDSGEDINQTIAFGSNLLDLEEHIDATEVYTMIVAESSSAVGTDGKPLRTSMIQSDQGIELYGHICKYVKIDDDTITNIYQLTEAARSRLSEAIASATTLNINAVDLSYVDVDTDKLIVGCKVRCVSEIHGVDSTFRLTAAKYPLDKPGNESYTFGMMPDAISSNAAKSAAAIERMSHKASKVVKAGYNINVTTLGYQAIGDMMVAVGAIPTSYAACPRDFVIDYSGAGFTSIPCITANPIFTSNPVAGAAIGVDIKNATTLGAVITVSCTVTASIPIGLMWQAIGF